MQAIVRRGWWTALVLALGCGGGGTSSDVTDWAGVDDGGTETTPDATDTGPETTPDGGPDGTPDTGPDTVPDTGDDTPPDTSPDDGLSPEGTGEGFDFVRDSTPGCDPTVCQIRCAMGGYATGTCVDIECVCSGTGDGGAVDGWDPDGVVIPDVLSDILPDAIDGWGDFEFPDGFELPEGWEFSADATPDATIDVGTCEMSTCFEACRADGHTFGFCNAAGECVCY